MLMGSLSTKTLREMKDQGLVEIGELAKSHRQHGRFELAGRLDQFSQATAEYIRLLENTIRSCRADLKAIEAMHASAKPAAVARNPEGDRTGTSGDLGQLRAQPLLDDIPGERPDMDATQRTGESA